MHPTQSPLFKLVAIGESSAQYMDGILRQQAGISFSQYKLLAVLEWDPRLPPRLVAENLRQTEASVSRQMKLLQEKGILTIEQDVLNRRRHIPTLTPKGSQAVEAAGALVQTHFQQAVVEQTGLTRQQVAAILGAFSAALDHARKKH